jgi:hypothetical protein
MLRIMPFIPVPRTVQMAVKQTFGGIPLVNLCYFTVSGSVPVITQGLADTIAELIEAQYEASGLAALLSGAWTFDSVTVTDLTSSSAPQFDGHADPLQGGDGAQVLDGSTCGMIEWATGLRGRSFRGRWFQTGFTVASNVGGKPAPAIVTALTDFGNLMIGAFHASGPPSEDLAVVSRFSGMQLNTTGRGRLRRVPVPRVAGIATPITGAAGETVWKSQRRRAFVG